MHRGTIILDNTTTVKRNGKKGLEIVTPSRTWYLFDEGQNSIEDWMRDISDIIGTL